MEKKQDVIESNLKRPLLYSLIGSVLFGALLGIAIVLRGEWGWYEIRTLLTTVIIAVASLCGLAAELSKTSLSKNFLALASQILALAAAATLLLITWADLHSEALWKFAACISIFAVATVHVCLLSIAQLRGRARWVFAFAWQAIFGLATLLSAMILFELFDEGFNRFLAVNSIVVAALTLIVPILHRIGRMDSFSTSDLMPIDQKNVEAIDAEIARLRKRIAKLENTRAKVVADDGAVSRRVLSDATAK